MSEIKSFEKDRLKEMFELQKKFNSKIYPELYANYCPIEYRETVTKDMAFSAIRELTELVDETNWKKHNIIRKEINKSNIIEEAIDVLKFWMNILLVWEFTDEDIYREFMRKSIVVEQKWLQENMLSKIVENDKVVCIDIDDVIAEYTKYFLDFAYNWMAIIDKPRSYFKTISDFIKYCGRSNYNNIKHEYRISGVKSKMPVVPGARALLDILNKKDYKIILLSARPYKQYTRIFADTLEWLNKNHLKYDAILFDRDKEDVVVKRFPNMVLFIDDDKRNIKKVTEAGYFCIFIGHDINDEFEYSQNVKVVSMLNDIIPFVEEMK